MTYTPRRCSKRWLDGDCPAEVLAIFDHPVFVDRYTIFYTQVESEHWLTFLSSSMHGDTYHGEMEPHEVAAYRYKNKHRYAKWSTLPDAVKNAVRRDLRTAA